MTARISATCRPPEPTKDVVANNAINTLPAGEESTFRAPFETLYAIVSRTSKLPAATIKGHLGSMEASVSSSKRH
jgi:hypothetical protein